jgi:hydrogenase maturation protease
MIDLRQQIERCAAGRVCFMGLGNTESGDDGFGVRLARELADAGLPDVIVAGSEPERFIGRAAECGHDHLVFLDAVDFGAPPGSAVWLDSGAMAGRFPQVSTHRISLGLLSRCAESSGKTRAWLLGVQPQSLRPARQLSPAVEATLQVLRGWLLEACAARATAR